ncbi:unnamed protein product [Phaedon cochleariae]|uniref:COMM domain-containing protein n=1 Tax=Phaedon cochleariae TaxID=80249 RepID=A0A9P0DHU0_PHACE|nr:unnamed protein product [Phaedon cochleariae]
MWITINTRLKNGVQLINSLNRQTFVQLLSHLSSNKPEVSFTEEELQKLQKLLGLTEETLQLLIQTISHILRQSSKVILKPTALQKELCEKLGFENENAEEFVKFWSVQMNDHFGDFENRMKLKNIAWELNVQSADQISNKESLPLARVQFNLMKLSDEKEDSLTVELDKNELLQFYNTLESIQMKLDNIQDVGK